MRPMSDSATLRNVEVMLIAAIVLITAALGFYTWGVFAEHGAGVLRWTHAACSRWAWPATRPARG